MWGDRRIELDVAGLPAVLTKRFLTGRATLTIEDHAMHLDGVLIATPILMGSPKESVVHLVNGHEVRFECRRKVLFPTYRRVLYRVSVDGSVVWERNVGLG